MSDIKRVSPEEAQALLEHGYVYVDVRSEPEFEAGHVPGAYNVPISHRRPGGPQPNPDFLTVMEAAFEKSARLIVGCGSGGRSSRAAQMLPAAGYGDLVDMQAGWDGSRDAFGRLQPGWGKKGLPVEMGQPEKRRYEDVKQSGKAQNQG